MTDLSNNYNLPYIVYGCLQLVACILVFTILCTKQSPTQPAREDGDMIKDDTELPEMGSPHNKHLALNQGEDIVFTSLHSLNSIPGM
jgi:hypothetical protein